MAVEAVWRFGFWAVPIRSAVVDVAGVGLRRRVTVGGLVAGPSREALSYNSGDE
jgi:hypothetical protein